MTIARQPVVQVQELPPPLTINVARATVLLPETKYTLT